jgi:hypothetical protein
MRSSFRVRRDGREEDGLSTHQRIGTLDVKDMPCKGEGSGIVLVEGLISFSISDG